MTSALTPRVIPEEAKRRLRILFIAKHARWEGALHPEDGNHALYHVETREMLRGLGLDLRTADRFEALFERPDADFVFPLLNRGGFLNSEMLAPLLCSRLGLPCLGGSPILRGLADDKHLAKLCAAARLIPTAPWMVFRKETASGAAAGAIPPRHGEGDRPPQAGGGVGPGPRPNYTSPGFPADPAALTRYVIKPNASSASWAVQDAHDWPAVEAAVADIHGQGHDAIVEPFLNGSDVEVPVITLDGEPVVMPMMLFEQADPSHLRTYYEKRDLVERAHKYRLVPFEDPDWTPVIADYTRAMAEEFRPFDYGRFEFRLDRERGTVQFLEVNLQANLWSQKVFGRSAALAGFSQAQLIETILHESLRRHGLLDPGAGDGARAR